MPIANASFSIAFLIGANLVPLIGALFFAWDAKLVLALFWIENLIIGAFNLIKMLITAFHQRIYGELFLCAFFVLHYGVFCSAHGSLLWEILELGTLPTLTVFGDDPAGFLAMFIEAASVVAAFVELYQPMIWLGILALALSHGASFIEHFILRGEVFKLTPKKLMVRPYKQIVVMHIGLILGAVALSKFGSPLWLLATIVVLKLLVDLKQHLGRHEQDKISLEQIKDI